MFKNTLLLCAGLFISGAAFAANSGYVEACADMQQQANSKITRSQAVKVCQCIESRHEKDVEKIQSMDNPTQAKVQKVMTDTANYCIKKAGISASGSKTGSASTNGSSQSEGSAMPKTGSKVGGITIRGIR